LVELGPKSEKCRGAAALGPHRGKGGRKARGRGVVVSFNSVFFTEGPTIVLSVDKKYDGDDAGGHPAASW